MGQGVTEPRLARASSSTLDSSPASQNPSAARVDEPSPPITFFHPLSGSSSARNVVMSFSSTSAAKLTLFDLPVRSADAAKSLTLKSGPIDNALLLQS